MMAPNVHDNPVTIVYHSNSDKIEMNNTVYNTILLQKTVNKRNIQKELE